MKKLLFVITVVFCLTSCKEKLGKYVYIDEGQILHVDNKCNSILEIKKARPVRVISITELQRGDWQRVCSRCIGDKEYAEIEKQIAQNIVADEQAKDIFRKFYDHLNDIGENQWYRFEDFYEYIRDKDNCRRLITQLEDKGYDVGNWIEDDFGKYKTDPLLQEIDSMLNVIQQR